jgi:hypothetical protein
VVLLDKSAADNSAVKPSCWPQGGREWVLFSAIVLIASFVRLYHLGHGLPDVVDVDSFKFVGEASRMLETGDSRPQDFQYPAAYTNLLRLSYRWLGIESFAARQLTARFVSAIAGVITVLAVYILARRLGGSIAAVTAAVMTAVSPLLIASSRAAATDSLTGLLMTLAIGILAVGRMTWLAAGTFGLLVGWAAGTKYTGAYVAPWLIVALVFTVWSKRHSAEAWWRAFGQACLAGAVMIGAFLATTPWFIREWPRYLDRLRLEADIQRTGQIGHIQAGWWDYLISTTPTCEQPWLGTSLFSDLGLVGLVAALAALVYALFGRMGRSAGLLAAYVAVYFVLISGPGHVKAIRFLVPIIPALFAVLGCASSRLIERFRWPAWTSSVIVAVLLAWPAWNTTQFLSKVGQPGTNELARQWAGENLAAQSRVFVLPFYTDDLARLPLVIYSIPNAGALQYRLPAGRGPNIESFPVYQGPLVDELIQQGAQYVVIASAVADAFAATPENVRWFPCSVEGFAGFLKRLKERSDELYSVEGEAAGRLGPDITIYRLHPN